MAIANATLTSKKLNLGKNPSIIIEGSAIITKKGRRSANSIITLTEHPDNERQQSDKKNEDLEQPSKNMVEDPVTISKKQEMEAKYDPELERIRNEHELKVGFNESNVCA